MKTTSYNFDAINTVLTITKDFARKASQLNSPEYKTMLQLRRDYPNLEIVMREGIKKRIDWEKEDIDFVGEASDGELAYPMILE